MSEIKIEIHFSKSRIQDPIICDLIRKNNITLNILKAHVTSNAEGLMLVELVGSNEEIDKALKFLEEKNVTYKLAKKGVNWKNESCTQCGACVVHCPSQALSANAVHEVNFDESKCIACELCLLVCPYHAVEQSA